MPKLTTKGQSAVMMFMVLLGAFGCTVLKSNFVEPTVTVSSIRMLPAKDINPRFEIQLHVVNPNRDAIDLQGLAYRLKLQGYPVLTGVAKDLPTIEGYGEGDVFLTATADVINSIRWFANLVTSQNETISYELEGELDMGRLLPIFRVTQKGEIDLFGKDTPRE